jgi:anti-sigma factor RsiW
MECPVKARDDVAVLMDYCAGKLEPRRAEAVEQHVTVCESCQQWVRQQQAVWSALDAWEAAPVPADFDRKLYQRIEREARPRWWPAFSLALVSTVALALLLIRPLPPAPVPLPRQAQVENVDAEHLEETLDDMEMLRDLSTAVSLDPRSM